VSKWLVKFSLLTYLHLTTSYKCWPCARKSRSFGSSEYEIPAFFKSSRNPSFRIGDDISAAVRSGWQQNWTLVFYL